MPRSRAYEIPREFEALAPYVVGDVVRDNGDIDAHCPLHDDSRRSAVINFEDGVYWCARCGGGSLDDLMSQRRSWTEPPDGAPRTRTVRRSSASVEGLPSPAQVLEWKRTLVSDPVLLDDLKASRGIWTKTVDYFDIGWDASKSAYTLPVYDSDGKIINVRRYQLRPPKNRRKIWGVDGHNQPQLFPISALIKSQRKDEGSIIVCGGEFDAIISNQYNFRTITRTNGDRAWRREWGKLFKGLVVYICHDMDRSGQDANRKVARALVRHAREVRIVRLPYPVTEDHGKDLTDWWLEHDADRDAFQRLLDEAQPFDESMEDDPEEVSPDPASVVDAFDSRKVGRPLALTVTVKGRREPGYSVPRKVAYRCTRDAGKQCAICPLYTEPDGIDHVVAGADPSVLEFLDASRHQVTELLRRLQGIQKCPKLRIKIAEHQAVEVLYARPSVEHSNGGGNADYKNIKLTSVGRHDTAPNQTVRVVGALHPDPRKQLNEFLTWDITRQETSLDRFEADAETIAVLKRFQPAPRQKPLAKLREIADDLSSHVTQIYGRPTLHAAMDLVFHSVVAFSFDNKALARGWLELLVVGDTRTGKSEVASRLTKFYGAGEVVLCEGATFAGILGGVQQFGASKEWAVTWGAIPLNDRRLVVLDEVSALSTDAIGQMSGVRSSGVAELHKIQQERTYARTRLIWLGNPRNARMSDYTYGVQAIRPLIGTAEDVARFDLAMSVSSGDVPSSEINHARGIGRQRYSREAARMLLRWTWSRTAANIRWEDDATAQVYRSAEDLGSRYVEDPPLIQAANVREKVARLAVAVAARLFSTDDRAEDIIVRRRHVLAAVSFIDVIYSNAGFGYGERSREVIEDRLQAIRNADVARRYLDNKPGLPKFLRSQGKFRRQDLEEILDVDREEANAIISQLYELRMVYKDKGDVRLTPTLHKLLREIA